MIAGMKKGVQDESGVCKTITGVMGGCAGVIEGCVQDDNVGNRGCVQEVTKTQSTFNTQTHTSTNTGLTLRAVDMHSSHTSLSPPRLDCNNTRRILSSVCRIRSCDKARG